MELVCENGRNDAKINKRKSGGTKESDISNTLRNISDLLSRSIEAVNQYRLIAVNAKGQRQTSKETHFAVFFVEVELPLVVRQMLVVVVIHHGAGVEDELDVDARGCEGNLCVAFATSIREADFPFLLRLVAEPRVSNL